MINSNIDTLQKRLLSILTEHANVVSSLNGLGKYDWARSAEYFFQAIATLVFEEQFEVADLKKNNNAVFDLKSSTKLIQVTSQLGAEKIKKTLEAKLALDDDLGPIYFFLIGDRPKYKQNTFSSIGFCQSQIWGTAELVKAISAKEFGHLQRACQIAEQYLTVENAREQLDKADLLHQIESLMEEVVVFRDEENRHHRADLVRNAGEGTYPNYNKWMQLFNRQMEGIFSASSRIHEVVNSEGYPLVNAQADYHTLRGLFIKAKSTFKRITPDIKSTLELKRLIDQLERAQADVQRINFEISALETRTFREIFMST